VTSAYVRTDSGGGGGESHGNPTVGRRMPSFEIKVSLKAYLAKRLFDSFNLEKKYLISIL